MGREAYYTRELATEAQALRMAHAADDRAVGGRIPAAMSHQALHLGDVRHGLDFACAAHAGTQGAVTPTTAAMLAAMEPAPTPLVVTPRRACER